MGFSQECVECNSGESQAAEQSSRMSGTTVERTDVPGHTSYTTYTCEAYCSTEYNRHLCVTTSTMEYLQLRTKETV